MGSQAPVNTASIRAAAQHIARTGTITPHQLAALSALDASLTDTQRQRFTELWRAQGSPAAPPPPPPWLAPALAIIKEWEGCRLTAYRCPAGIWTIGWGTTRLIDRPVREGDTITQQMADDLLQNTVEITARELLMLLPMARDWSANRIAALTSWAYNVGLSAVEESTLRRRILDREDPNTVIREELPRWNKAGGKPLEGLTRRRAAEVALFVGQQPARGNPLNVPWFAQLDSATDQARRMCFSSSCAMLLAFLKPGVLTGPNGDDQYLARVRQFGDTTDPAAQIQALASYGVRARFTTQADFTTLEQQIEAGIPVPCGYLHRGPVSAPSGGGHWLCVVGHTPTHVIVHDPLGEADLVNGTTIGGTARFAHYGRTRFGRRWIVEGEGSGWAVLAQA